MGFFGGGGRGGRGGGGGFRGRGGGGGGRGGGRGFRGGGGGGRGGGRFGGYNEGPPDQVIELGYFTHPCQNDLVCKAVIEDVPYFNAPIFLEDKKQIGKIDEIFGSPRNYLVSIKLMEDMKVKKFKPNDKLYIDPNKLLPLKRFLPQPGGGKVEKRGGGGRGGRGGRGGGGGFRGGRGGRGGGGGGFGRGRGGGGGFGRGGGGGFGRGGGGGGFRRGGGGGGGGWGR